MEGHLTNAIPFIFKTVLCGRSHFSYLMNEEEGSNGPLFLGPAGREFPSSIFPQGAQGVHARDGEWSSEGPRSQPGFPSGLRGQFLEACHA